MAMYSPELSTLCTNIYITAPEKILIVRSCSEKFDFNTTKTVKSI